MSDSYIGTIVAWPINFAPQNWMFCNGQILNINQYQALYALLGTNYGGDGRTTFALPNLNGRVPVGAFMGGTDTGLTKYPLGTSSGLEQNALTLQNMPVHSHSYSTNAEVAIPVCNNDGTTGTPSNTGILGLATASGRAANIYSTSSSNATLKPFTTPVAGATTPAGQGVPIDNRQPYLALNFIICVYGFYPPRPD